MRPRHGKPHERRSYTYRRRTRDRQGQMLYQTAGCRPQQRLPLRRRRRKDHRQKDGRAQNLRTRQVHRRPRPILPLPIQRLWRAGI